MLKTIVKYLWSIFHRLSSYLHIYVIRSLVYDEDPFPAVGSSHDLVRIKALELCRRMLISKNVKGCTAELGVYKGHFASKINEVFPDRPLYLFDTFEGFNREDAAFDAGEEFSGATHDFSDTTIEKVRSAMKHPQQCVFIKGRFPESAHSIETTFAFVSIDADLYLPTKHGLEYFYPRMEKNGYMFVHDYFNQHYKGVKKAVDEFCDNEHIHIVPIPDLAGSVIITK